MIEVQAAYKLGTLECTSIPSPASLLGILPEKQPLLERIASGWQDAELPGRVPVAFLSGAARSGLRNTLPAQKIPLGESLQEGIVQQESTASEQEASAPCPAGRQITSPPP